MPISLNITQLRRQVMSVATLGTCVLSIYSGEICAKDNDYVLEIKNHLFYPSELIVPANKKFKLLIINHDKTPEEFDSFDLNREKVVFPNSSAVIYVGPLKPGRFHFFGEYNPNTAIGSLIAIKTLKQPKKPVKADNYAN